MTEMSQRKNNAELSLMQWFLDGGVRRHQGGASPYAPYNM